MYYIYHIKRPNMSISEGYIGVSNNPQRRFTEHKISCKSTTPNNIILARAFSKYSDIEMAILFTFNTETEAYAKELELRPTKNIGWNIAIGGACPPNQTGYTHTKEAKQKIQKRSMGTNNPMSGKSGLSCPSTKPANIYEAATRKLVASNVCIEQWAKENNCRANHLQATARNKRKQTGGYYAQYI